MALDRRPGRHGALLAGALLILAALAPPSIAAPLSDPAPALAGVAKQAEDQSLPVAQRIEAIKIMGVWATDQVREPLVALLKDPLPEVREAAARALGWPGNSGATAALRVRVEDAGEVPPVRAEALRSFGKIGDESARPLVLGWIDNPDAQVRSAALWSVTFGTLQSPADRITLLRKFVQDRGQELILRSQAAAALGRAKDVEAVDVLASLVEHEPQIPMPVPPDPASQQETMMVRYREARDVRAWAARALGQIGDRRALPVLLKAADDREDFFVRYQALEGLAAWNVPEARPVFVRRLEDPFTGNRIMALVGLGRAGDRSDTDG